MLVLDNVALGFGGAPLFAPLSLTIKGGDIALLTAPSGAGKSTLLRWICGMPTNGLTGDGHVSLNGRPLNSVAVEKRRIGMMFQEPLMFPHLTVADNLGFGLTRGGSAAQRRDIIARQLERVGMAGFEERDPMTLSGGQKARVALIRSLLAEPEALLLDEPFSGLDDVIRDDFAQLVREEIKARKLPVVMVSHDPRDRDYADHPAIPLSSPDQVV
ncbi:MAG: ATP-binding cassette domain-containing protein [Alphaproteobacteria bacterium]|nr:ATP-binding cassette domain-containing protein [Alphaproteobacteria bacterium]